MKKAILILSFFTYTLYSFSQFVDTRRFYLGMTYMGAISMDKNFHFFKPFDKKFFPEIKFTTSTDFIDFNDVNIQFNFETGLATSGFKYSYKPDSSFYIRSYGLSLGVGLNFDFSQLEWKERPISLSVNITPFFQWGNLFFAYDEDSKTSEMDIGDDMFVPNYGINFQILYDLFPEADYSLEAYYGVSLGLKEKTTNQANITYQFLSQSIGLAFKIDD